MTRIAAALGVLAPHLYPQEQITEAFARVVLGAATDRLPLLERLHTATGIRQRALALPLEDYAHLDGFTAANDAFLRVGTDLGAQALSGALARAGIAPDEVDLIMTSTVTGVGAPNLDARILPRVGLREDVKRLPVFGLGCVAGAAGIARLHDYLVGHPDDVAVLVNVELCSLTVQRDDTSTANLVASGLFGDGAAAVVLVGERRAQRLGLAAAPQVVDTRSRFYPGTERVMGFDVGSSGFRIVLAASVAQVVEENLGEDMRGFLSGHDLKSGDIDTWIAHPGGPKVLDAVERSLGIAPGALDVARESLADMGNLSSASVVHVLERTLAAGPQPAGSTGVLLAMGPGFCAELVLLRW